MNYHGIEISKDELRQFCRKHGIARLALFGSVLREDFSPQGDIDVLVGFEPNVRVGLRFFQIQRELSALLGRRVDLNTPGFLSKYFRDEVLAEAQVQYEAQHDAA